MAPLMVSCAQQPPPDEALMLIKKNWIGFVFAFLLPVVVVLMWWGAFNHTDIRETRSAPLYYAYQDFYGNLADLPDLQDKVRFQLMSQQVQPERPIVVLYTDPRSTKKDEQHAHVGYLIAAGAAVKQPLQTAALPARDVLRATVKASLQLAPGMAYQALFNYLKPQGKDIRLPTVEIYTPGTSINQMGTLTVDMPD